MPSTSATGLPIMTSGDAPNVPADVGINLAGALDKVTVPLFASTTARDAAYANAQFGLCFVGTSVDAGTLYRRRGGSWYEIADKGSLIGPWVTSGLSVPGASGFSVTSYGFRLVGPGLAAMMVDTLYSGADITPSAVFNISDTNAFTMPAGWRVNSPRDWPSVDVVNMGFWAYGGRLQSSGTVVLDSSRTSAVLTSGTTLRWTSVYPI